MITWWVALVPAAFVALFAAAEHHRAERWRELAVRWLDEANEQGAAAQRAEADALQLYRHLQTASAELLAAQGALEDYGAHDERCEWRPHHDAELDCTCGLVDAKERARAAVRALER